MVWDLADLFMALMAIVIFLLGKVAFAALKDLWNSVRKGGTSIYARNMGSDNMECWNEGYSELKKEA
jgi:hypothetical protein